MCFFRQGSNQREGRALKQAEAEGLKQMIIDPHVHTRCYSGCSSIEPEDLIDRALEEGLQGLLLTEHGILWKADRLNPLKECAAEQGLVLLAWQEVTCLEQGRRKDFLVIGVEQSLGGRLSPRELIERVHGEGGVVIAAHPFKPSRLGVGYHGIGDEVYDLDVDAVELLHPDHDERARGKVEAVAEDKGIPMTGGSDAHELYQLGTFATRFQDPITTVEDLVREIRAGRIEPVNGVSRV